MTARGLVIGLLVSGLSMTTGRAEESWCDVVFKDVAAEAAAVVLARVERAEDGEATLTLAQVLKAGPQAPVLRVGPPDLEEYRLNFGDELLLALDQAGQRLRSTRGLGMCRAINVLPLHGGKLKSRDRVDYDSGRGALTLERLRDELRDLPAASRDVGASR